MSLFQTVLTTEASLHSVMAAVLHHLPLTHHIIILLPHRQAVCAHEQLKTPLFLRFINMMINDATGHYSTERTGPELNTILRNGHGHADVI